MTIRRELPQPFGEPADRHFEQHDERNLGDRGDEKQAVRPAGKAQQRYGHEAAGEGEHAVVPSLDGFLRILATGA